MLALCALYAHTAHANDVKSLIIELSDSNHLILSLTETPQTANCGKNLFISSKELEMDIAIISGCPVATIHAPAGSYAETYAKEHGYTFETAE